MSETTTQERPTRHNRHVPAQDTAPQTAPETAPLTPSRTIAIDIDGVTVTLPRRFAAGHVCTDAEGRIVDAHIIAQFRNNQVANAKARAKRFAAGGKAEDRAWSVDQYVTEYMANGGYLPNVGSHDGMSPTDKMRHEAAWRAWAQLIAEHNSAISKGEAAVITRAGAKPVTLIRVPGKTKDMSEDAHKAAVEAFQETRLALTGRILEMPAYAERVQMQLDAMMAAKASAKAEKPAEVTVEGGADLL